ncbi:pyrroline-5-carboxylate reductase [Actinoplanes bogorensis]|uniref:Pyrroline-5-carboxylate reductase n=1 Tax=Paractinoplanes bogorensis TaxID=1610840 RepID=A0ABS5YRW0_9ACTN|nr:pyrroline-5-carboxylate reductase [Actinoplanes bogorensis]MBU2666179.1 pyrroline-5-carboxylate reductase [Actinoplanes bogorensis]
MTTVAIIGGGTVGGALAGAILRGGHPADQLIVTVRREEHAARLRAELACEVLLDNAEATRRADVVIVATKPQDIGPALEAAGTGRLVVSMAAGVTTAVLEKRLGPESRVVRVMTNTGLMVDQAMSVISPGRHATEADLDLAETLLTSGGRVIRLPEDQQDAVSALSGHGAAYLYFIVEVLTQAGVYAGVAQPIARELLIQTMTGATTLLRESGQHPVELREAIMSRGGATISAFREIERHNVRDALFDAVMAATRRGAELSELA